MKYTAIAIIALFGTLLDGSAAVLVSGFSSNTNGALVGQNAPEGNTWTQIGGTATNPLTITTGVLAIKPSGQGAAIQVLGSGTDTGDFYYGVTLNLSAAQATGNMFLSFSASNASAPGGGARLYAKSSGAGYVLGGSVATTSSYGATVLNFNTDYQIVFHYNLVTGSSNDFFKLYVNPTNTSNEGANTAYLSALNATGLTALQYFQITQTSAGNGPTGNISNLSISTTFAEAIVPEPATWALLAFSLTTVVVLRRRKA